MIATLLRALAAVLGLLAPPIALYRISVEVADASAGFSPDVAYAALMGLTATVAGSLAALVAIRARGTASNRVFALFLACLALGCADERGYLLVQRLLAAAGAEGAAAAFAAWSGVVYTALVATGLAATLRISQLFPRPLPADAVRNARGPRRLRALQARLLGPAPAWLGVGACGWLFLVAMGRVADAAILLQMAFVLAVLALATLNLAVAYRRGDDADRGRIFWFLEAGMITIGALTLASGLEVAFHAYDARSALVVWGHALILPLGLLGTAVALAIAVLYTGAVDSRLVVRRTLLYGTVGFALTAVFVGIESLVEEVVASRLALPDRAGGYVAGIVAALVFGPLRGAIDRRIGQGRAPAPPATTPAAERVRPEP